MTRGASRAAIRWCPHCRDVGAPAESCSRCSPGTAATVPLVRGLASIQLASEGNLVHYHGEETTKLIGLGLLSMIPLAAACALAWELTWMATLLLGTSFVGLPTLAFVDARRAGAMRTSDPELMPPAAPTLPEPLASEADESDAAESDDTAAERHPGTQPRGPRSLMVVHGEATALGPHVSAPLTGDECLAYRIDIRAGQEIELVARYTSPNEFVITSADGTQLMISGIVELIASAYQVIEPAHRARFQVSDTELLPALFSHGAWACELAVRHGDTIRVEGALSGEQRANPLGTSYRQSGTMNVLRGEPGHPVVVTVLD